MNRDQSQNDRTDDFVLADETVSCTPLPPRIGRYRIERLLGEGGFGVVYLARDDQLARYVAIKVPHARLILRPEDVEAYLTEARTVANLDHPNIVPVHDVGSTDDFPCFVVSKFIDGTDLAKRLKHSRPELREAVELVATVAEALHHAHKQGLVHRDVKPGNILLDKSGKPFVADFGLALREQEVGSGPCYAGTPAYMSPEQARGEGHRVDSRSDIFSLGLVLYELLTGRRPFQGHSKHDLLEKIATLEVRPPRQWDETLPKEVERICIKSLSNRAAERYTTAQDMADDLRCWLQCPTGSEPGQAGAIPPAAANAPAPQRPPAGGLAASRTPATTIEPDGSPVAPSSDRQVPKVIPKGLRSFDVNDADFFLELLPGPRDRNGMPESVRFWKSRIETREPDETFCVGLIYGPSGCGKSSLVKAGLLPRLAPSVVKVYVEASGGDTEERLLRSLRRRLPGLNDEAGLVEVVAALRRGHGLAPGDKMLLVIDQFEQWLHAGHHETVLGGEKGVELIRALRQCDGVRVQCLVMVRDDFWLAVSRFMQALEIRVVEGENSRLVDLFDERHARKVLAALGHAFGALPEWNRSKEQDAFLDQAVAALAQGGKVVSVRLALFAEMVKGKAWTPGTLREIGGAEGVGAAFLEETFSSPTAPPLHRLHQKTAQAVLAALLPEAGSDIKGHMRARDELLEASGCRNRPQQFDEVIALLDSELRLVTPADSESLEEDGDNSPLRAPREAVVTGEGGHHVSMVGVRADATSAKNYQLTHDYLVPSLRTWLTRKQKATRRGRAELRLADLASLWAAKPENRRLPSLVEYLQIRLYTPRRGWNDSQRRMMRQAGRMHGVRAGIVAAMVVVAGIVSFGVGNAVVEKHNATLAEGFVEAFVNADVAQVPSLLTSIEAYRTWADPMLETRFKQAADGSRQRLNLALALVPVDESKMNYLRDQLLVVTPIQFPVVRDLLNSHKEAIVEPLWSVALDPTQKTQPRFQAACALATYAPGDPRWKRIAVFVAGHLVTLQASDLVAWRAALEPAKGPLVEPLVAIYRNPVLDQQQRSFATETLADYAAGQVSVMADLVMDADEKQFAILFPKLQQVGEEGLPPLQAEVAKPLTGASEVAREAVARRQANAAVALVRMKHAEKAWPLLEHGPDPTARSYLIHRLAPWGADAALIVHRLDEESEVSIRRALILSLGGFDAATLPADLRKPLIAKLLDLYRDAADPGLRGAAGWLLRRPGWDQAQRLAEIDAQLQVDARQLLARAAADKRQWYVNRQGQTFVIIDAQKPFAMGSPLGESDRDVNEIQHQRQIGRRYAIAATCVTTAQFARFRAERPGEVRHPENYVPSDDCPQIGMTWYEAAEYCNWLSEKEWKSADQDCYEPNKDGKFDVGMRAKDNYAALQGYRLPTEAEWEFACRAGAETRFNFGGSDAVLINYAWYRANAANRAWPVASLKPNDFGLFDMHGNVWQWCECPKRDYLASDVAVADRPESAVVANDARGAMRGGSFRNVPGLVRAAYRGSQGPETRQLWVGFRPARTIMVLGPASVGTNR